jgi:hypothetical protein
VRGRIDRLTDLQLGDAGAPDVRKDLVGHPDHVIRGELARRLAELPPGHPSVADGKWRASWPLDRERNATDERGFWPQVTRFEELWRAHIARWPDSRDESSGPDRRDDPPGSWRGACDRYLNPDDNAEAEKQIALLRGPEPAVTRLLKQIELGNPHGALLVGIEHRLKGEERLKEKIADKMSIKGLPNPAEAAKEINDAVRYTFCVSADEYVAAHAGVGRQLESAGYRKAYGKNHWLEDANYNGINTRWTTSDGGRFELQFHTSESSYAKERLTHPPYRRLREHTTTPPERAELLAFQREVCAAVPKPPGIWQIEDFIGRRQDD